MSQKPTKVLNYADFQAFLVQYETLIPDLVNSDYSVKDRMSALMELLNQNNELMAASSKTNFVPKELFAIARPIEEVQAVLRNSNESLNDILLTLEPRSKFQYR